MSKTQEVLLSHVISSQYTETPVLLTEPGNHLSIYQFSTSPGVFLMASSTAGAGVVRLNFTELGELINNLSLLRAGLPSTSADNCRDCDENNSGVTL